MDWMSDVMDVIKNRINQSKSIIFENGVECCYSAVSSIKREQLQSIAPFLACFPKLALALSDVGYKGSRFFVLLLPSVPPSRHSRHSLHSLSSTFPLL
jgi:hypothetical protein